MCADNALSQNNNIKVAPDDWWWHVLRTHTPPLSPDAHVYDWIRFITQKCGSRRCIRVRGWVSDVGGWVTCGVDDECRGRWTGLGGGVMRGREKKGWQRGSGGHSVKGCVWHIDRCPWVYIYTYIYMYVRPHAVTRFPRVPFQNPLINTVHLLMMGYWIVSRTPPASGRPR